jgi:predicted nucleic acid-binding protein
MIFVDTWAWVALAREEDQYHVAAQKAHRRLKKKRRRYVTTDYVLSEVITFLYRKQEPAEAQAFINGLLEAVQQGIHQLVAVSPPQFDRAWELRQKYDDKPDISFVDFTSMVVMQDLSATEVFTGDAHFLQVNLGFRLIP